MRNRQQTPAGSEPKIMNTYGRLPIALSHGQGCRVWDINGKPYLDALGGIAVNTLGHGHPKLVPALQDQIGKLIHSCNYYHVPNQENAGGQTGRAVGADQRVLLQHRPGSQRSGA
jgi:acetylornithine/succinyldiaminopimelate/putrescine aminotransferase